MSVSLGKSSVHTEAQNPTVTAKSSSSLGDTIGRGRVELPHKVVRPPASRKRSNSNRESPIPSGSTPERGHSPESLDPSDPETEGSLPAIEAYLDPSDSDNLESRPRRDTSDVGLRSSQDISHTRRSRQLHTAPYRPHDRLSRVYVDDRLDRRNRQDFQEQSTYRDRSRSPPRTMSYGGNGSEREKRFHYRIVLLIPPILLVGIVLRKSCHLPC